MPSSESSSSPSRTKVSDILGRAWLVWVMRLLIGGVFIFSGFVKAIDPWGSVLKIGEYFDVWGFHVPNTIVTCAAFLLGGFEFVWGSLLVMGCYRRSSVWMLTLMMAFMLPLTLYIAISSPVDDCGCFGDFLVISNTATFVKNIFITLGLVYLIIFNGRVSGLFITYIQWIIGGLVTFYILAIELYGFNIQPLQDYRRFSPGTMLVGNAQDQDEDEREVEMEFVYERDGRRATFTMDNLPDSSWTFVERRIIGGDVDGSDGFTVIDDGEDVAPELIDNEVEMFVVTIPELRRVDLSCTYLLNELNDFINARGGTMVAFTGDDEEGIEWWRDISMATYPMVHAEPKELRELARGNAALVYLDKGVVKWKRTVASIPNTLITETPSRELINHLDPHHSDVLRALTGAFGLILVVIFVLDRSGKLITWHILRRRRKDATTETPESRG
ncbi:MAG: DoxX family protein [Muribaculaceae bacterium]|nr:DoxX family protein [Muribaculaceae bacterium]